MHTCGPNFGILCRFGSIIFIFFQIDTFVYNKEAKSVGKQQNGNLLKFTAFEWIQKYGHCTASFHNVARMCPFLSSICGKTEKCWYL